MAWSKLTLVTGLFGLLLIGLASDAVAAEGRRGRECRRGERVGIQDLDMSPDPVMEGQRIRAWKVKIRLDGDRECDTEIEIREGNELVGRARRYTLRPGINEIEISPAEAYRFRGREHCFNVIVDLEGTRRSADADRKFCARQRPGWSLSEPGDRGGGGPPYRDR